MKIGNNGNLVLGPFDESTPCLMIVLMNCQTKLRINHLTAVKSVAILERQWDMIGSLRKGRWATCCPRVAGRESPTVNNFRIMLLRFRNKTFFYGVGLLDLRPTPEHRRDP
ncbi:alpha-2 adrenergic receptor [Trichonephila clavipes]|nr:alpha-2 adrenergic receptor [Trichonephila clavipes]